MAKKRKYILQFLIFVLCLVSNSLICNAQIISQRSGCNVSAEDSIADLMNNALLNRSYLR